MIRRTFVSGKMNKDVDERLLPDGQYRHAENIRLSNSNGEDVGAVEKVKGTVKLTNFNLSSEAKTIGRYPYFAGFKLYYMVYGDDTDLVIEYDILNKQMNILLQSEKGGVLNFDKNHIITGIVLFINDDPKKNLIGWTDDYNPPRLVNIERSKTYGPDGFTEEDISLIKPPPRFSPRIGLTYSGTSLENNIIEKYLCFAYRYKYLDGEYSALSQFHDPAFSPGQFKLDYQTMENEGMQNEFNAVRITYNTGSKRVTDIQIVFKETNSNTIYLVETFNKKELGFNDNAEESFVFANSKIYTVLPEDELYRGFDNVPHLAKAMEQVGNRIIFSNYVEGHDLIDEFGNEIVFDYDLSFKSTDVNGKNLNTAIINTNVERDTFRIDLNGTELNEGNRIIFDVILQDSEHLEGNFSGSFNYILSRNFASVQELAQDEEFIIFIEDVMSSRFFSEYETEPPINSTITDQKGFEIISVSGTTIGILGPIITYDTGRVSRWIFLEEGTEASYQNFSSNASLKVNRDYEVTMIYRDPQGRSTVSLTCPDNTIHIPIQYSAFKNQIIVNINHRPPVWADRYCFAIKQNRFNYETIYCTIFFEDGLYRWVKLEGANVDKVKEGDTLIVKSDLDGVVEDLIKVRVLEVTRQEENFLEDNEDDDGNEIIEPSGLYMKIKPSGFNMNYSGNTLNYIQAFDHSHKRPDIHLGGTGDQENVGEFGEINSDDQFEFYPINSGSKITINIESWEKNRNDNWYGENREFIVSGNYENFQEWFLTEVKTLEYGGLKDNIFWEFRDGGRELYVRSNDGGYGAGGKRRLLGEISMYLTDGLVIFETESKENTADIFYETSQTFEIIDGKHHGNVSNQTTSSPATIELNAFNCFCMGNGAESYKIKDVVEKNFLNFDLRPTTTSIEKYKRIRRIKDFTWGDPYVPSSNINGLNVFNLSTGNFKDDLDQKYGSVQFLLNRDTDLVAFQEDKIHKVLFGKDVLMNADGTYNLTAIDRVLGGHVPYSGEYGISLNPESIAKDGNRIYFTDEKRGILGRLSINGISEISENGMIKWFKDLFKSTANKKKVGAFDPYFDQYILSADDTAIYNPIVTIDCSGSFTRSDFMGEIEFYIEYGTFTGEAGFSYSSNGVPVRYQITWGSQNFDTGFRGDPSYNQQLQDLGLPIVQGPGNDNFTFQKNTSLPREIHVKVIAPIEGAEFTVQGNCIVHEKLTVISVIVGDESDTGKHILNRFKWFNGNFSSPYKRYETYFGEEELVLYDRIDGESGVSVFPAEGSEVIIESFKGTDHTANFEEEDRLGYLVSDTLYGPGEIEDLIDAAFFVQTVNQEDGNGNITVSGEFIFNRQSNEKYLYLIWDYVRKNWPPVAVDDFVSMFRGETEIIHVLDNDFDPEGDPLTVEIVRSSYYGNLVVNPDNTVSYTHDGSKHLSDSFTYRLFDGKAYSNVAMVSIALENRAPIAEDDSANVIKGQSVIIDILANDYDPDGDDIEIIIVTQPQYGSIQMNPDDTITYTHNNSDNFVDEFTYKLSDGIDESNVATVTVAIGVPCSGGLNASGNIGIYELTMVVGTDLGETGIEYDAIGIPDRFQIEYNGQIVADSKYVGSSLSGNPPSYPNLIGTHNNLAVLEYDGQAFVPTGETRNITVTQNDVADYIGGKGSLVFNKTTKTPTYIKIIVTGPVSGTAWNLSGICPDSGVPPVANADNFSVIKGGTINCDILHNDVYYTASPQVNLGSQPPNGTIQLNPDNTVTYTHNGGEIPVSGYDSFTYSLTENGLNSNGVEVRIRIIENPVANDDTAETDQDISVNINVLANDIGGSSSLVLNSVTVMNQPNNGSAVPNANGTITYTPDSGYTGQDIFTYKVSNSDGLESNNALVTVTINETFNLVDDTMVVEQGDSKFFDILANDDLPPTPYSTSVISGPSHGSAFFSGTGSYRNLFYENDGSTAETDNIEYGVTKDGVEKTADVNILISAWRSRTTSNVNNGAWSNIAYSEGIGRFLTVGDKNNNFNAMYSSNGIGWTGVTIPNKDKWLGVCVGNVSGSDRYFAVAPGTSNAFAYSNNGTSWTFGNLPSAIDANDNWRSIAYGNGILVAIAMDVSTAKVIYSTDLGSTWNNSTITAGSWVRVRFLNGQFVIVNSGNTTSGIAYSNNGSSWSYANTPFGGIDDIAFGNNTYAAITNRQTGASTFRSDLLVSTDGGSNYTSIDNPSGATARMNLTAVYFGNGRFYAIKSRDNLDDTASSVYKSDNGTTWQEEQSQSSTGWNDIAYGARRFVVVADNAYTGSTTQKVQTKEW